MNEKIYRKKSLDRIKSPESLDDYIRVANPGVWLLLVSVIVLLIGACVWGIWGHIDSTVPAAVCVENGEAVCTVADEDASSVQTGMTVRFADCEAVIRETADPEDTEPVFPLWADQLPADGFYEGKVVIQSYSPVSFVLN